MPERIIVVGSTGLIGASVVELLSGNYEIVGASRSSTPGLDIRRDDSIRAFFREVGSFSHVITVAGDAAFGPLSGMDRARLMTGVKSKMLGQMMVAIQALRYLPERGSITLTSGMLAETPMPGSAGVAMVNGSINSFVRAAALELKGGRRINAVSPGWIREAMERLGRDATGGVPVAGVAELYQRAVEGTDNGEVIRA